MTEPGSPRRNALLAGLLVVTLGPSALAQVSPGPLSAPHRPLGGNLDCLKCHGIGGQRVLDEKCLDCHREIGWLVERRRGLHAREAGRGCATCHPEHAGSDFALISWPGGGPERFDHRRAGWELAGRHGRAACATCHSRAEFAISPALRLAPGARSGRGFVGLETDCGGCHEDIHRSALGAECSRCHGEESWKLPGFDHGRTEFPLRAKHAAVPCAKCHEAPGLKLPVDRAGRPHPLFKPLPHAECADCHHDPHGGGLGPACSRCHVEDGFRTVRRGGFDHERTRYPLRGKHATVACERCHDPRRDGWREKPAFDRCGSCHPEAHAEQLAAEGLRPDCAECHTVDGYTASTFTVERHARTGFPLSGRHRQVACAACHPKNPAGHTAEALGTSGVLLRPSRAPCAGCHGDPHAGQLRSRKDGGACEACHTADSYKPSTFTVADHASAFLLEGSHARAPCAACHGALRSGLPPWPPDVDLGKARVGFHPSKSCAGCHWDPHAALAGGSEGKETRRGCADCHGTDAFRPARVDVELHRGFSFPLDGAHRAVACVSCHEELAAPAATSSLLAVAEHRRPLTFRNPRTRCEECHRDPHGGQFASRADRGACAACHGVDAFLPALRFDHRRDTSFPLEGAHARLACSRCHRSLVDETGRRITVFRPTPRRCEDCHGKGREPGGPGPEAPSDRGSD